MTDAELVAKKLGLIEAYVHDLRTLGRPDDLATDIREQRFTLHTLQLAAQAALDVASHIVSDDRLGEPETSRDLFGLLARHGWIEGELATKLEDMAGFRNVLVHGYADVDLGVVEDVVRHRLDDLLEFVQAIRPRLP
ncbi:MAG: type VII toxin-antitoxin system HepT family RNase toxin [Planctomycetota bacterium]